MHDRKVRQQVVEQMSDTDGDDDDDHHHHHHHPTDGSNQICFHRAYSLLQRSTCPVTLQVTAQRKRE